MSLKPTSVAQSEPVTYRKLVEAAVIFLGLQAPVAFAQGSAISDQLLRQLGQVIQGAIQPKPEPPQAPATQPQAPPAQSVPQMSKRKANQEASPLPSSPFALGGTVDDQWFGKWKSGPSYSFEISAKRFRYTELVGDEGIYQKRSQNCIWSPAKDALRESTVSAGSKCQFSDSQRMKSKAELVRSFQEAFRRYPGVIEKPAQTKMLSDLEVMKPGPHKVVVLNNGNDVTELIFDGEHLFQIVDGDWNSVLVYTRSSVEGTAQSGCKFKLITESGRQVAVAPAELMRRNGQMQFRISKTASGGTLEVRFTRLAKYKHRFTPSEIIGQLNEGRAYGEFTSVKHKERLQRVKGWELLSGSYVAKFDLSKTLFQIFLLPESGTFFNFRLDNSSEGGADFDPDSSVATKGCAAVMNGL